MSPFDGTLRSDRSWRFDADPETVWATIASTGDYRGWWPWLRSWDGGALVGGAVWACCVAPPLPYRVRFDVHFVRVEPPHLIAADVRGDIEGVADLRLAAEGTGTTARLRSQLRPASLLLRSVHLTAPFVARKGHDWILERGSEQFRVRALGEAEAGS